MIDNYTPSWMDEELTLLQDMAKRFAREEVEPNLERWCEQGFTERDVWLKAGENGILCPDISSEYGGSDGSFGHEVIVAGALSRVGDGAFRPGRAIHVVAAHYVERYGTDAQKQQWLPKMCSGEVISGMGMTEPNGGTDLQNMKTTAIKDGDHYVINGSKTFITNGSIGDMLVLATKTDPTQKAKGVSLFLFDTKTEGFSVGKRLKKVGLHGSDTCELFFQDCRVPAEALLGGIEGQGFYQMMKDLTYERVLGGVTCGYLAEHALSLATEYAKERDIFGKKLIDLQRTRFELAEMKTDLAVARSFADTAVQQMIDGAMSNDMSSMVKWWLSEKLCEVVDRCVQIYGGHGYILEYPIARLYVDARIERVYAGANEVLKDLIGRSL